MTKVYEKVGLTKEDVLYIQSWLFPMMDETDSIGEMINKTVNKFNENDLWYALYLIGSEMGQAGVKKQLGMIHVLDPKNV